MELLERLWGLLDGSWKLSWGLLGGSWKGFGSPSGAFGDVLGMETLYFLKMKVAPRWEHDFENL